MESAIIALQNASTSIELKAAVDAIPREETYSLAEIREAVVQQQNLIVDAPTADAVVLFLSDFSRSRSNSYTLSTDGIRDLIMDVLAPKISEGLPVENLGATICNITYEKNSDGEIYMNPKSFSAILGCFSRATTAGSVQWIVRSIDNISIYNPADANKILNDLPVVDAYSAVIPHATTDEAVQWISDTINKILNNNEPAQKLFGTPAFLERSKSMEKYITSNDAKEAFKKLVDALQFVIDYPRPVQALRDASTSAELKAALDALPRASVCFTAEVRDAILAKKNLITDAPAAEAAASLLNKFGVADENRLLRTAEIHDLVIDVIAPKVSDDDGVEVLGYTVCSIVQDKPAAELYSNPKSLSTILSCFHRAKTAGSAESIALSIRSISYHNPDVNSIFNDLPVVEAFSAIIPFATTADSFQWVCTSLFTSLKFNEPGQIRFATTAFSQTIRAMAQYTTTDFAKNAYLDVLNVLHPFLTRVTFGESLRAASTSSELITVLNEVMNQYYCWASFIDNLVEKQHLIQDQETLSAARRFISWSADKDLTAVRNPELYRLFQNVLLPSSLKFVEVIPEVHYALSSTIRDNDEGKEFFTTTSFKDYVVASLPHSDESLFGLLNNLLGSNEKAQQIFGTQDLIDGLKSKFSGQWMSWPNSNVIKILSDNIARVNLEALKKLAADLNHDIKEEHLKKLSEHELEVHHLPEVDSALLVAMGFSSLAAIEVKVFIRKVIDKNNGVAIHHQDLIKLQQLEQLRRENTDLRKQHQDLVTSSTKEIAALKNEIVSLQAQRDKS